MSKKWKTRNNDSSQSGRRPKRPAYVTFDDEDRVDFVTGFRRRKEQRRVKAARDLVHLQKKQKQEFRQQKRQEENEQLIEAGYLSDPVDDFLEEDNPVINELNLKKLTETT